MKWIVLMMLLIGCFKKFDSHFNEKILKLLIRSAVF